MINNYYKSTTIKQYIMRQRFKTSRICSSDNYILSKRVHIRSIIDFQNNNKALVEKIIKKRVNKITYVKRIDNIYFDTKHDSNIEINAWFNFILDMIDEQLYKAMNKLEKIDSSFVIEDVPTSNMRLSRLKHR